MRTLLVLIGLFTLGISGAYAQAAAQTTNQRWSLQECIEYAFANSINVSRSNLQVQSSQAELFQSRASMLPTVNASGQQAYNFGRFVDPTTNLFIQQNTRTNNFGFNANLLLFQGLQVQNTIRAFQALFRANILDVEQAKNEVALNVALSYLDVLNNQELLEVARNVVAATELQVQRTEKLVQAGSQPQTELLTLQAQLATDKAQYVATQNNLRIARLNLMQAMNLPSTPNFEIEPIEVADPAVEPYLQSAQEVFNIALETLPSVQSADLKVKSSQHDVAAARGFYYPRLSVVAGMNTFYSNARPRGSGEFFLRADTTGFVNNNPALPVITTFQAQGQEAYPFFDQLSDNLGKFIGININIPILNGWQTRTQVNRAIIRSKSNELDAQNVRIQLRQSIEQAYNAMEAATANYLSAQDQVASLDLAFRATESRFNVGVANSVEYNLAKVNLDRARANLISAKYDYIFRLKILDFYQNKPLAF